MVGICLCDGRSAARCVAVWHTFIVLHCGVAHFQMCCIAFHCAAWRHSALLMALNYANLSFHHLRLQAIACLLLGFEAAVTAVVGHAVSRAAVQLWRTVHRQAGVYC